MSHAEEFRKFTGRSADAPAAFEDGRCRYLAAALGLSARARGELAKLAAERTGAENLTFAVLRLAVPALPALVADRDAGVHLHVDSKAVFPLWFSAAGFRGTPPWKAYAAQRAATAAGTACGVVFPRKGVMHGMVIHDAGVEADPPPGASTVALVYSYALRGEPRTVVVQSFADFAARLRRTRT